MENPLNPINQIKDKSPACIAYDFERQEMPMAGSGRKQPDYDDLILFLIAKLLFV